MRKIQSINASSVERPRKSRAGMVIFFVMMMIIAPFAYEGGSIVLARWQFMYGTYWEPKTPVLDAVRDLSRAMNRDICRRTNGSLLAGNWNPSLAIPLAVCWAGLGAFFLRRGR